VRAHWDVNVTSDLIGPKESQGLDDAIEGYLWLDPMNDVLSGHDSHPLAGCGEAGQAGAIGNLDAKALRLHRSLPVRGGQPA